MIKRTIIAAAGVAFILAGCEEEPQDIEATEEAVEERVEADYDYEGTRPEAAEEQAYGTGTAGGATAAESEQLAQQQQPTPGTTPGTEQEQLGMEPEPGQGLQQPGWQQQQPMAQREGEATSTQSDLGWSATLQRIQRELRNNDMQVVGRVRVNQLQQQQERQQQQRTEEMGKPEEQQRVEQQQPGQEQRAQQQERRGRERAELILFADPNAVGDVSADPLQALEAPTAILVYEDELSGEVLVAYDDPSLSHIVDAAVRDTRGQQQQQQREQQGKMQEEEQQPGTQRETTGTQRETGTQQQEGGTQQQPMQEEGTQY